MKDTYTYWLAEYTSWGGLGYFFALPDRAGNHKRFISDEVAVEALVKNRESDKRYNITDRKYRITKFTVTEESFPITFNEDVQLELFSVDRNEPIRPLSESINLVNQALGYTGIPAKFKL